METTLLQELSNQDIDWLITTGELIEMASGAILLQPRQPLETLYILLEGTLIVFQPESKPDIIWLSDGEMMGSLPGLDLDGQWMTVRTATRCRALAIPRSTLLSKCSEDSGFAAHLYRASAVLLANRLARLTQQLTKQSGHSNTFNQPQRDSIALFAALQDDDLDWLVAAGQVQHLAAKTILIESGRPIDAWHILLDGAVALTTAPVDPNLVLSAFTGNQPDQSELEFARLSRGDTIGEGLFINPDVAATTARTVRETQVLSIPRWRLAAKLLHDPGFAARFYQVLAVLLLNQQQMLMQQYLGQSSTSNHELDSQFLTQVALAEARFEWMLKRIQTKIPVGGGVKW